MKKAPEKESTVSRETKLLDEYIQENPYEILSDLLDAMPDLRRKARESAERYIAAVEMDGVADSIFTSLKQIAAEDLYDSSGRTRYGYVDPGERADEMFLEVIEPYIEDMKRCLDLLRLEEAAKHCKGILLGLYRFEKEAFTEFQDWIPDTPKDCFENVLEIWTKQSPDPQTLADMDKFINKNCPEWYSRRGSKRR